MHRFKRQISSRNDGNRFEITVFNPDTTAYMPLITVYGFKQQEMIWQYPVKSINDKPQARNRNIYAGITEKYDGFGYD